MLFATAGGSSADSYATFIAFFAFSTKRQSFSFNGIDILRAVALFIFLPTPTGTRAIAPRFSDMLVSNMRHGNDGPTCNTYRLLFAIFLVACRMSRVACLCQFKYIHAHPLVEAVPEVLV